MKIDVTQNVLDWDGSPFQTTTRTCPTCRRPEEKSPLLTLRSVCLTALGATLDADRKTNAETKYQRFAIGLRIQRDDVVDLTVKEIAALQERINQVYLSAIVVAQAHQMLEPGEPEPAPKK